MRSRRRMPRPHLRPALRARETLRRAAMTSVGLANHFAARWPLARLFTGTQRTMLLPAVAIVLGLVTAGLGLFRAAPHAHASVPPGYIALVNQKGILMTDWITQTQAEEAMPFEETTPAARERVLQE